MRLPDHRLVWSFFILAALASGPAYSQSENDSPPLKSRTDHWTAYVGGEWDFLKNEGPPLNGTDWQEAHWGIGYSEPSSFSLVFSHRVVGRTHQWDNIFGLDAYAKLPGPFSFRGFAGGSPDHDFVYRLRGEGELTVSLLKALQVGAGYWFIKYDTTDIHILTPLLSLFAGNFEFDFRYLNILDTGADERFNAYSFRVSDTFDDRWLRPFAGIVFGERIFGILTVQQAPVQKGYLAFAGNTFGLSRRLDLSLSVSYAHEDPAFTYLGIGSDLKLRF
ncbi:MAG: YaiO family outer membrane beta-barrel protein [Pseudomonadota bacterium]